jgi:hypothetical protein
MHCHTLEELMANVARTKGLNVLLSDAGDIFDGLMPSDPGKAAVLHYEFARRKTTLYFLDDVLERHQPGMTSDQLKQLCYNMGNCPTHDDILWFENRFRHPVRRKSNSKPSGRPKSKNEDHVALMVELYKSKSLLEVAKELLTRGITGPNGRPYSPQNVDYYLHRRKK